MWIRENTDEMRGTDNNDLAHRVLRVLIWVTCIHVHGSVSATSLDAFGEQEGERYALTDSATAIAAAAQAPAAVSAPACASGDLAAAPARECCQMFISWPSMHIGRSWGLLPVDKHERWQHLNCDQWSQALARARSRAPPARWAFKRDTHGRPEPLWIYLVGDSSLRIFNAALVARLNGTLQDAKFGSYRAEGSKGGCEGKYDNECSTEGRHEFTFACIREFIDWESRTRLTYTFKTTAAQNVTVLDHLATPTTQPDVFVLATGAHDFYQGSSVSAAVHGALQWILSMLRHYPQSKFVFMNLVACEHGHAGRFNHAIALHLGQRTNAGDFSRVVVLDREGNTQGRRGTSTCIGWHAYGAAVQEHVTAFLGMMPGRWPTVDTTPDV